MKLSPLFATCFHPQQMFGSSLFIVINLLTSITTTSPTVSNLFTDYYSKGVTDEMLTSDTNLLSDLVNRYEEYLNKEMSAARSKTWEQLKRIMTNSFANNERLREALKISSQPQLKLIAGNFDDLLTEVNLFSHKSSELFELILEKSRQMKINSFEQITLDEEDGFSERVMDVLFEKTVKLRKGVKGKELPKSVNIVQKTTTPNNTLNFTVSLCEVVDEIVWLCILRNCVNRLKVYSPGILTRIVSSRNTRTEQLYVALYVARVKVLLYVAFLGPQMKDYYKKKTFREKVINSKPARCLKNCK